ncbi:MAG: N-acetyltransferase family protein [Haloarculaceae archaeon]
MDVREATVADVPAVQQVATVAWHAAHDPIVGPAAVDEFLDEYYSAERLRGHLADESQTLLVAEDHGDDVTSAGEGGIAGFALVTSIDDEPGVFGLGSLYVLPGRWGERIGTRLLDRAEAVVRRRGGSRLRLGVMAGNDRAIAFYESRGFERVGTDRDERLDVERHTYAKDV